MIRYSYLWLSEATSGREEGLKDRPCAVVVVTADVGDRKRVLALPITHSPPVDIRFAVELPAATKRRLGLDDQRSWIVLSEWNDFLWPGPDIRPLPGKGAETAVLGFLPPGLFEHMRRRFLALARQQLSRRVARTE